MMNYAPIILFVYKRLDHLKLVIKSLKKNKECQKSTLIIYSDSNKDMKDKHDVEQVRSFIKKIKGFKKVEINLRRKNFGLANNIVNGINKIFKKYEKAIILEDDIIVSSSFLKYMNSNLNLYSKYKNVASIHGYCYPLKNKNRINDFFFIKGADCWGWGTWKRAWKKYINNAEYLLKKIQNQKSQKEFDFNYSYPFFEMLKITNETNHSWAIKWYASAFINNMLTLYPKKSFTENIGNDGSGTNSSNVNYYLIKNLNKTVKFSKIKIEENINARKEFENFFNIIKVKNKSFLQRIFNFLNI